MSLLRKAERRKPKNQPEEALSHRAKSAPIRGRNHFGTVGDFKSESGEICSRNGGRFASDSAIYEAAFANGHTEWRIFLNPDGKIEGLFFHP
jgi:hypothetical protein